MVIAHEVPVPYNLLKTSRDGITNMRNSSIDHPYHQGIQEVLSSYDISPCKYIWDDACGGDRKIAMFREPRKSSAARYTCPDGILIHGKDVVMVIEIEEPSVSGFTPNRIGGKQLSPPLHPTL